MAKYWECVREAGDFRGVRLHDLRHSFASYAARSAETFPIIGKLLGHRKLESKSRYAHLDDRHLLIAVQDIGYAIDRMFVTGGRGEGRSWSRLSFAEASGVGWSPLWQGCPSYRARSSSTARAMA